MRYSDTVTKITVDSVNNTYNYISKKQVLSADDLRNRFTWVDQIGEGQGTYYRSPLGLSTSVFDFNPINNVEENIVISDLSGNGHTGTAKVSSITREGMYFNGINDFINIQNFEGSKSFTIVADYYQMHTGDRAVFHYGNPANYSQGYGLIQTTYYTAARLNGSNYNTEVYKRPFTKSVIALTFDSTAKIGATYENGNLLVSKSMTTIPTTGDTFVANIGKGYTNSAYFEGLISSVMIYNRALTAEEISTLYNSSGASVTNGLELYYDLTRYHRSSDNGNYPIIKEVSLPYQRFVALPRAGALGSFSPINYPNLGTSNVTRTSMKGKYHVYKSGLDIVNIEFDSMPTDLSFSYKIGKYDSGKIRVDKKVYSIKYDFNEDIEFNIKTSFENINETYYSKDLANTISMRNSDYYYIVDNKLYKNTTKLTDNALNIHDNLVLLKNNMIYNLDEEKATKYIPSDGILTREVPLYEYKNENSLVSVYHGFTKVTDGEKDVIKDVQIIKNKSDTYVFDIDFKNNYQSFNTYNTMEYQIILNSDNKLVTLKNGLNMGSLFFNDDIEAIAFDRNNSTPVIMIRYTDGSIIAVNYYDGNTVFEANSPDTGLFSFLSRNFINDGKVIDTKNNSYNESKKLVNNLNNIDNDVIKEKLNIDTESSKNYSDKDRFKTYYNSTKKEYEVIDTYTSLQVDEKNVNKNSNETIESDTALYDYFYGSASKNGIEKGKSYLYMIIIVIIVINLLVFMRKGFVKYGKEKKKA